MEYGRLATELTNSRTENLDEMSALEIALLMNELDAGAIRAVRAAANEIARTADEAAKRILNGGRLIYMGAGTSGRLGVLDASECPPTFGVSSDTVVGIIAGGDTAIRTAVEGAEDDPELAKRDIEKLNISEKDIVVAISASGTAPYCHGALVRAREAGAVCVSMCCNENAKLSALADIAIEMPTGAEALSGSTRLRAGTATKLALNMISTIAMVRAGKVYKNLMVDVRASNTKLRDRTVRITMNALGVNRETAEDCLARADYSIKRAIVMKECSVDKTAAQQALDSNGGFVKRAIASLKNV